MRSSRAACKTLHSVKSCVIPECRCWWLCKMPFPRRWAGCTRTECSASRQFLAESVGMQQARAGHALQSPHTGLCWMQRLAAGKASSRSAGGLCRTPAHDSPRGSQRCPPHSFCLETRLLPVLPAPGKQQ
jgi:hypothetical protein